MTDLIFLENLLERFPSPKPDRPLFTMYWNKTLPDIAARENLKFSHLQQLQVLCSIYCERDELEETLLLEGRTYISEGRNGTQRKLRPEVGLLKTCYAEIRNYSKMLGLVLVEDKVFNNAPEEEKNDFDM